MYLQHILDQIKVGLNILAKGPTWAVRTRLLTTIFQHLNRDGDHCLSLVDHIHQHYEEIRNQIQGVFEIETESSLIIAIPFKNSLDLSLRNIINKVFQLMMTVSLNTTGLPLISEDTKAWNLYSRPQGRFSAWIKLDQLLRKVIDLISMIKLHFQLQYHIPLDILSEHSRTTHDLSLNASEEVFVISFMTEQLGHLYKNVCTFLNRCCLYLEVTEKLLINLPCTEDQLSSNFNITKWPTDMCAIQSQLVQLIEEQKSAYSKTMLQQQLGLQTIRVTAKI